LKGTSLVALVLLGAAPVSAVELPVGTSLSIRLTTRVSSRTSRPGATVGAVLIAPVELDGGIALPAGEALRGTVREVAKRDGRASLRLDFSELVDEDGGARPIVARITTIEDSRESVAADGRIVGVKSMRRLPAPFVVLAMVVADIHPVLIAAFAVGRLALRAATHSAIDYPPGVELTLSLEEPLEIAGSVPPLPPPAAAPALAAIVQSLPFRTQSAKHHRDADLTNLLFVGSRSELEGAFTEAGWTRARPMGLRAWLRGAWALASKRPYKSAAVSRHELEGRSPDFVFEKQNDTLAQRHHVRIWQCQEGPAGETVWVGAATHDVAIVFDRRDHAFTHRIDSRIDGEREKIVNDLQFTGEVAAASVVERSVARGLDAPGQPIETDGGVAVVVLRHEASAPASPAIRTAGTLPPDGEPFPRQ
jgi:hypothetical protein